jgi:uncharacterized membrane protein
MSNTIIEILLVIGGILGIVFIGLCNNKRFMEFINNYWFGDK